MKNRCISCVLILMLTLVFSLAGVPAFASDIGDTVSGFELYDSEQTSTDLSDYTIYIENDSGYDRPEFELGKDESLSLDTMNIELRHGDEVLSSDKYDLEVLAYFNDSVNEYYDPVEDTGELNFGCNRRYSDLIGQSSLFCDFIIIAKARTGSGYTGETNKKQGFRIYSPFCLDYDIPIIEVNDDYRVVNYDSWHDCYQIPTDQAANIKPVIKDHAGNELEGFDYCITYYNWTGQYDCIDGSDRFPTKNGHYYAKIEGMSQYYYGITFFDFYIGKRLEGSMFDVESAVYDGKEQTPAVITDLTDSDYSVTYTNNVNAGTGTATITGKGGYTGTITKTFIIARKAVDPSVILSAASYVYNGSPRTPEVTVMDGSTTLVKDTDYTVTYPSAKNAGTYKVTVNLKGNYSGTAYKSFKITKAANKLTVKPKTAKIKYSKLKKKARTVKRARVMTVSKKYGKVTYKLAGAKKGSKKIKLSKAKKIFKITSTTGTVKVNKGLKKGTYKITVKVKAAGGTNYTNVTKPVTFKIKVE